MVERNKNYLMTRLEGIRMCLKDDKEIYKRFLKTQHILKI